MLGIPVGLAVANAGEWAFHKYVLHGLGCKPKSFWSFHWHEHHRDVRRNEHIDPRYGRETIVDSLRTWSPLGKEAAGLALGGLVFAPLLPVAPFFVGTVWYSMARYYRVHKRAHLDTTWAREKLPWHYDHHMGDDQHKNWCVTHPWFDNVMKTRKPYIGTEREQQDRAKRERLVSRRAAMAAADHLAMAAG